MTHLLKQSIFRFTLIFSLLFVLSSATPAKEERSEKDYWSLIVTMQHTFFVGECTVTITQQVEYVFNEFFVLVGARLYGPAHFTISCGTHNPFLYEIRSADVAFDVSSGDIIDIDFESQTDDTVNGIISNIDFLAAYKSWVNSEKP